MTNWLKKYTLLTFDYLDSTNKEAIRLAKTGISGNFVIAANAQTNGYGQQKRKWIAADGNMNISIMIEHNYNFNNLFQLLFLTGNIIHQILLSYAKEKNIDIDIKLKWPNDILINSKKAIGILIETISLPHANFIIIGIGANIKEHPEIKNKDITNLHAEGLEPIIATRLMSDIVECLDIYLDKWQHNYDFIAIKNNWLQHAFLLNKIISINQDKSIIKGIFRGIKNDGSLQIELPNGEMQFITYGQIYEPLI